jgi:hypothetical protein
MNLSVRLHNKATNFDSKKPLQVIPLARGTSKFNSRSRIVIIVNEI